MAFCSTCGARLEPGSAACVACGSPAIPDAPAPPGPGPGAPSLSAVPPPSELPRTTLGSSGGYAPPATPPAWGTPPPSGGWQAPAGAPQAQASGAPQAPPQWSQAPPAAFPQGGQQWGAAPQSGWTPPAGGYPPGYAPPGNFTPGYTPPGFQGGAAFPGRPAAGPNNNFKIIALIALIAGGIWWYMGVAADPKAVVNRCMDGIQEMDATKVLDCVRPSDRAQLQQQLPVMFAQLKAKGVAIKMDQRKLDVADQKGETCVVRCAYVASLSAPGEQPQQGPLQDEVQLAKEGGKWYIVSSRLFLTLMAQQRGRM